MPTHLQESKFICNFAVEFGSDTKFEHTERAFCLRPKCQSLETLYYSGTSINDRCDCVSVNWYRLLSVYTIHGVGHYFSFIAKWFSRARHLVNEKYPHALQYKNQ